jgi:transposase
VCAPRRRRTATASARVVLLAADGVTGRTIAREVGLSPQSVSKWRLRFLEFGLAGLDDADRSGRPPIYGPTDRLVLMAKVTSELPELTSEWSHSELHEAMAAAGTAISASQIGRILAADDVRPHKVEG